MIEVTNIKYINAPNPQPADIGWGFFWCWLCRLIFYYVVLTKI